MLLRKSRVVLRGDGEWRNPSWADTGARCMVFPCETRCCGFSRAPEARVVSFDLLNRFPLLVALGLCSVFFKWICSMIFEIEMRVVVFRSLLQFCSVSFPIKILFFSLLKGLEVVSGSWFVLRREISL